MAKSKTKKTSGKTSGKKALPAAKIKPGKLNIPKISVIIAVIAVICIVIFICKGKNPAKPPVSAPVPATAAPAATVAVNTPVPNIPGTNISVTDGKSLNDVSRGVKSKVAIKNIGLEEAKYLFDTRKAIFVDARPQAEFEQQHIKGAISIPVNMAAQQIAKNSSTLSRGGKIIVAYCHGIGCHLSDETAYALYDAGYKNVVIFFAGWNSWTAAKYPVEK